MIIPEAMTAGGPEHEGEQAPRSVPPVVVPRWVQLVALPLFVVALWILAKAAGPVLLVFIVAAMVALILNPLVSVIERRAHLPRGFAVAAVYLGVLGVLVVAGFLLANPIANQADTIQRDLPKLVDDANNQLADLQGWLDRNNINIRVKRQGETAIQTLSDNLRRSSGNIASTATGLLTGVVAAGFGLVLVIVVSVYMLLYGPRIGALVRRVMPPGDGTPEDDYPARIGHAVYGYVRGQLLFSLAMGAGCGVGLYLLGLVGVFPAGKTYALAFAVFFGLMELIPYVGPILGALPPLLVALFTHPLDIVWVGLFFVALQQIEGHVVAPQIFGHTLRINPLLVIFALLTGYEIYGIMGALLALPLAAVLRETFIYLRRHLVLEPWGTVSPVTVAGALPAGEERCCRECGAPADADDAHCRRCGAALDVACRQ
jgi:predicted PurR-regulated permease PerM